MPHSYDAWLESEQEPSPPPFRFLSRSLSEPTEQHTEHGLLTYSAVSEMQAPTSAEDAPTKPIGIDAAKANIAALKLEVDDVLACLAAAQAQLDALTVSDLFGEPAPSTPRSLIRQLTTATPTLEEIAPDIAPIAHVLPPGLAVTFGPHRATLADARSAQAAADASNRELTTIENGQAMLQPRQTRRSAAFIARRVAETANTTATDVGKEAALTTTVSIRHRTWVALAFCYRLMATVAARANAAAQRYPACQQLFNQPLRSFSELRMRVRERVLVNSPRPLLCDVGYNATTTSFSFRLPNGEVSSQHPSGCSGLAPAFSSDGSIVRPMQPPADSTLVLAPERNGGWCYYDSALGSCQWHAPVVSAPLRTCELSQLPSWGMPPPLLAANVTIGSPVLARETQWTPIYEDHEHRILLLHRLTGAVRAAPWVALRTINGGIYFANLITRQTRWTPPHRWMEDWVYRPSPNDFDIERYSAKRSHPLLGPHSLAIRDLIEPGLARLRVEGGAPYLLEPYSKSTLLSDAFDSYRTHPSATSSSHPTCVSEMVGIMASDIESD